ncbi:reverse transcriptase domain-containing protein [Tanacetum coccineum]|uniref:Reverse transcriptase domain-containing protein n=1 Tax=Tanacetum coccineum TaxID=301880 RepID=A0ABQ5E522_9ASTR
MEKFETSPDSPPITVIDPDDQPMWSSTRSLAPTPTNFLEISNLFRYGENQEEAVMLRSFPFSLSGEAKTWLNELNEGTITSWNEMREAFISRYFSLAKFRRLLNEIHSFHQLDDPTQGILDASGIILYNTPNEAFKILKDKVLLKLDFSKESQNPKPKTIVSSGGSNINSDPVILVEKFKTLTTKIDSEILIIKKELKEMRDGRRDDEGNHALQIYMKDDTPMCDPHEASYVQGYHGGYHD